MTIKWTEGWVHLAMRKVLREDGWQLIAGEYPGGSDHELYPLNVVDPSLAKDSSPDPRRHSFGELIPDIIALRNRHLFIGEAKVSFNAGDVAKLTKLLTERKDDLIQALDKFATERGKKELFPTSSLIFLPLLIFVEPKTDPVVEKGFSYLLLRSHTEGRFIGEINNVS